MGMVGEKEERWSWCRGRGCDDDGFYEIDGLMMDIPFHDDR